MKVTYPLSTGDGDEYLILIEYLEKSLFPDDVINILGDVNIADITLERVSGNSITHPKVLLEIANLIGGFLLDNEDTILYFYCDDMHEIARRDPSLSPQKFRSNFFAKMFERYVQSKQESNFVDIPIEIKSDRDIYIHLIARTKHLVYVDAIKKMLLEMENK